MKAQSLHPWQVTTAEAERIQRQLAPKVSHTNHIHRVCLVAGVDISSPNAGGRARGAVVILNYPELELQEEKVVEEGLGFPYVPGLLSFRESPLILAAAERLSLTPDLVLVDGQGLAHPRRFGLASHLGLLWDIPTIGCAKSLLCGRPGVLGEEAGSWTEIRDNEEIVGAVLRTKDGTRPVYVSIGHKVDLKTAIGWVLACCQGYRIPEPLRLAHLAASGYPRPRLRPPRSGGVFQGKLL